MVQDATLQECSGYFQQELFLDLFFLPPFLLNKMATLSQETQPFSINADRSGLLVSLIKASCLLCGCEEPEHGFRLA